MPTKISNIAIMSLGGYKNVFPLWKSRRAHMYATTFSTALATGERRAILDLAQFLSTSIVLVAISMSFTVAHASAWGADVYDSRRVQGEGCMRVGRPESTCMSILFGSAYS